MIINCILNNCFNGMAIEKINQFVQNVNNMPLRRAVPKGNGMIFIPTNGAGLGHMTRLLSIAKRVKKIDPFMEIIFFSTSSAIYPIYEEGFTGYYLPPQTLLPDYIQPMQWSNLMKEELKRIMLFYRPKVLVFDGAYPYAGLISAMRCIPQIKKVWVNRGMSKEKADEKSKQRKIYFDNIIEPGEAGIENIGKDGYHYSAPVIFLEKSELLDRQSVRTHWNIPKDCKLMYVQLGAGVINDIKKTTSVILSFLQMRNDFFAVFGESVIGDKLDISQQNVIVLRDFPNSKYFNAFDIAISAGGYNTFHELLYFGVPSIFVPNDNTKKDNQVKRVMNAVNNRAGFIWDGLSAQVLSQAVDAAILYRDAIVANSQNLIKSNGADQIAKLLLEKA